MKKQNLKVTSRAAHSFKEVMGGSLGNRSSSLYSQPSYFTGRLRDNRQVRQKGNPRMLDVIKESIGVMRQRAWGDMHTFERTHRGHLIYICSDCESTGENKTLKPSGNQ